MKNNKHQNTQNWIEELEQDYEILPETHPPMYLMHKYWARKPSNIVRSYIEKYSTPGEIILDPFMGSGVTIIEANILGRKAIGSDINPMACFIAEQNGQDVDCNLLKNAYQELKTQILRDVPGIYKALYGIQCPICKNDAKITHIIWENKAYLEKKTIQGTSGIRNKILEIRLQCEMCKKLHFSPDTNPDMFSHLSKIIEIREEEAKNISKLNHIEIPTFRFQYNTSNSFLQLRHSLRNEPTLEQLFSPLNLVFLSYLKQEIDKLQEKYESVKKTLQFCFSSTIGQASNMVWVIDARKGKKLAKPQVGSWTHHFFWDPSVFFEINAWECFQERFKKIYLGFQNLRERKINNHSFNFKISPDFLHLSNLTPVFITNGSSESLHLPDNSVDFIFTDPPYGDSIQYGELNSLWAGFLGFDMQKYLEQISEKEIVMNTHQKKGLLEYKEGLAKVFAEMYRVLKPGKVMIITFHNTSFEIRNALIESVIKNGFDLKQILHQMPPRIPIKSLLHANGSPMGDYYIRFMKPKNGVSRGDQNMISAQPEQIKIQIKHIIDEILIKRGEPTAELWLMNFIDTYLFREKLIPLQNFNQYVQELRNSQDYTIVEKYKWWFSPNREKLHCETPLTEKIKYFIENYVKNMKMSPTKGKQQVTEIKTKKLTFNQEIYNELYKKYRGIYTPDKVEVNQILQQLIKKK